MVRAVINGRDYLLRLDTGAARTQLVTDEYLAGLACTGRDSSAGAFGRTGDRDLVTVGELTIGSLVLTDLTVARVDGPGQQSLLGMDVLRRYCCQFRFGTSELILADSAATADLDLLLDDRGHAYAELCWGDVAASACWDSGAGISVVSTEFYRQHPELFTEAGQTDGTDSTGASFSTPTFTLAGPSTGGTTLGPSKVTIIDLSPLNRGLEFPMDAILGYPMLSQANWLFDFPARRWAAPQLLAR